MTADAAYWRACAGESMLYAGDFQNAKQLLNGVTRRANAKPAKETATLLDAFHQHRSRQIGRSQVANRILIELHNGECPLNRSPALQEAVEGALDEAVPERMVLSLRETLGIIGANEWYKKGVYIDALQANIHASYGVFSPVRGEYLRLVNEATLHDLQVAWDIGTGTGVIAAILATRGVRQVVATDTSVRALQCAAENLQRLKPGSSVRLEETSFFPDGTADLIVCNPPWLPAKASSSIERAIYDPKSKMLRGFLNGVNARLNPSGEAWLIMSNLAELIGLRGATDLADWIDQANLCVVEKLDTLPQHPKAKDESDPLFEARSKEVTSLYRLRSKG